MDICSILRHLFRRRSRPARAGGGQPDLEAHGDGGAPLKIGGHVELSPSYVSLTFGPDLLLAVLATGGVSAWNALAARLQRANIVPPSYLIEDIPPVMACLSFQNADLQGRDLSGIDLSWCDCAGAAFSGCNLRGATLWCIEGASLRDADLRDARLLSHDVSGVDFTGSDLRGTIFCDHLICSEDKPPIRLPARLVAKCRPVPRDGGRRGQSCHDGVNGKQTVQFPGGDAMKAGTDKQGGRHEDRNPDTREQHHQEGNAHPSPTSGIAAQEAPLRTAAALEFCAAHVPPLLGLDMRSSSLASVDVGGLDNVSQRPRRGNVLLRPRV